MAGAFDFSAQAQLEFAGRLLGESHGDDAIEFAAAARDDGHDAAYECGGFAGAGGGLDDQRGIEVGADAIAHALIGGRRCHWAWREIRAHGLLRRSRRLSSR